MRPIVSLDIETTGLDADTDAIIEIGAVKFNGTRIDGEYSTLLNPGRPIPNFIQQLTNITDGMVAKAPTLRKALPELEAFVGDAIIIGHNVKFDLKFLRKQKLFADNDILDTYDLAAVLMPNAGKYSLGALAQANGIIVNNAHRALDDAKLSLDLYRKLFARALELPLDVLAEIVRLGQDITWGGDLFFEEALRTRSKEKVSSALKVTRDQVLGPLFAAKGEAVKPLKPVEQREPIDTDQIAAILEDGGAFEKYFDSFEHRPEQVRMLKAVANAFNNNEHALIEAGTGTGKSVAYLLPALHWAVQNNERVVISTNTINLQDQLITKDIPAIQKALGLDFRAALLKGRSNYLCPRRLESIRHRGPRNADEVRLLAKLLVWLPNSKTGDVAEITLSGPGERGAWMRLSAEDDNCTSERCSSQMSGICPMYQAKQAAQAAHVIIVNHALLFADVATGSQLLPSYQRLVIDEGHHLEAATTNGLSYEVSQKDIEESLRELGGPASGLLGQTLKACRDVIPNGEFLILSSAVDKAYNAISTALIHTGHFFDLTSQFAQNINNNSRDDNASNYSRQIRVVAGTRAQPGWDEVEDAWTNLNSALTPVIENLTKLSKGLTELDAHEIEDREEITSSLAAAARRLDEFAGQTTALISKPDATMIYWIDISGDGERLSLHVAPLNIGPLIEKHLWNEKESVVLSSATLTTAGKFDYIKKRLNAIKASELTVGSPFDYEKSTLLYVVNDIPEPVDRIGYQRAFEQGVLKLCLATKGRALILFTSHAQMKQTSQAIRGQLERANIVVYDQTEGSSRHQLLQNFRASEKAVLMGTRSFWEGVDVQGDALSVLVIAKLPFDVPSDPIVAARSETFENSFFDYSVPEAILRFRQGFGRLIRSKQDRGVVAIFDRRVLTKQYGRLFLQSLPKCTRRDAPLSQLPLMATQWLEAQEKLEFKE